ncbi:MAG TPA: TonB-dependent receptor [Saprospiraceae bacterium]|nr:TonB-dependent receptor [Saprospiraceae bacterium]HMZ73903.1 TonB-dependent receptor [Saprospiraceae bacterium]HNO36788.1 TonB-dependent receptor [Saprospiraceae bacterium]
MKNPFYKLLILLLLPVLVNAQEKQDTMHTIKLKAIEITGQLNKNTTVTKLPEVYNTYIVSGKKNEVIKLENANVNLAEKTGRQVFAKVPGVFVYDMDGSGNQINVSTRGLDPHRSWEFNIRQDGIMVNSDMYGYPASHYAMPLEAISRIELIRGTSALQYGAQFGGMINYINKSPDTSRNVGFENVSTVGSYGLMSSYNSIGGKIGKLTYSGYFAARKSDGYRKNSDSKYDGEYLSLNYDASKTLAIKAQLARSNYVYHIPGPLNDSMFAADPRASTRSRNYFNPEIWVPSLQFFFNPSSRTSIELTSSAVLGERRSVQIEGAAGTWDLIDPATGNYKPRQVDIDGFNSYTSELRLRHDYSLLGQNSTLIAGVRYINNDLKRRQVGVGTTGSDADFSADPNSFKRDLSFKTNNIALYVENLFKLTHKWSISPGFRYENGVSKMSGIIKYLDAADVPNEIKHNFALLGISTQYEFNANTKAYAGFSQAYRPVIFKDIIPSSILETTSKNLKDAYGYNLEAGVAGKLGSKLTYDLSVFSVYIKNRLGAQVITDDTSKVTIFRTNIGDSRTNGIEVFVQYNIFETSTTSMNIFTSTSYRDSKYENAVVRAGNENKNVDGNQVQSIPNWISRNGIEVQYKRIGFNVLHSYVSESFADPLNTVTPPKNGSVGLVPEYHLIDAGFSYIVSKNFQLRLNVNNLLNKSYFTKRPEFYPGPAIWPSDGRSVQFSVSTKF